MKLEEVKKALTNYQKGSFIRVGWTSSIESAKSRKNGITVQKLSEATVRIGIRYNNIHAVQVMRENAASGEKKPYTIWFEHLEDFPMVIQHLQDQEKKYLQLFTVNKGAAPKVTYTVTSWAGTREVTKSELEELGYCNPSAFNKSETLTFNIPLENLTFIGKVQ